MTLALLLACATPPAPEARAPAAERSIPAESDRPVTGVSGSVASGERTVLARFRDGAMGSEIVAVEGGVERVLVPASFNADRPAISGDGERVAFVSGKTGLASIWVVPFAGGEPVQVTNVGVARRKGERGAPEGFVPPPVDDSLRFEGNALVWTAPDGPRRAELP